jgi:exodeoxyribonuclease VII large subunit
MQQLALARERLDRAIAQVAGVRPDLLIASSQARTEVAAAAVRDQMTHFLERQTSRVAMLDRTLQAVGPAAVLARGFAVLEDGEGRVIRSVGSVASGVHLTARVSDGTIEAEVIAAHDDESAGPVG